MSAKQFSFIIVFFLLLTAAPFIADAGQKFKNIDTFKDRQNNSFGTRHNLEKETYSNSTAGHNFTMGHEMTKRSKEEEKQDEVVIINADVNAQAPVKP
ncbi:MAG: hypothetical protein ACNI27_02705 [Desulfovibrio sp.]